MHRLTRDECRILSAALRYYRDHTVFADKRPKCEYLSSLFWSSLKGFPVSRITDANKVLCLEACQKYIDTVEVVEVIDTLGWIVRKLQAVAPAGAVA